MVLYRQNEKTAIQHFPSFDARIQAAEVRSLRWNRGPKDVPGSIEYQLAADVHLERREIQGVQGSKRQEPHVVFGRETLPQIHEHPAKVSRIPIRPDEDEYFRKR